MCQGRVCILSAYALQPGKGLLVVVQLRDTSFSLAVKKSPQKILDKVGQALLY